MRKPLAPHVFLLRNLSRTLPMVLVIGLAVLLVAGIVSLVNSIPLSVRSIYGYSKAFAAALPRNDPAYLPELERELQKSPVPIERVLRIRVAFFNVRSIVGKLPFVLHGLSSEDAAFLRERLALGRLTGRLPSRNAPEAVITRRLATNLRLDIGDALLSPADPQNYSPQVVRVVGIHEGDLWFAYGDFDYVARHHLPPVDDLLIVAKDQRAFDRWAVEHFRGSRARILTHEELLRETDDSLRVLLQLLSVVIGLLVVVVTVMIGLFINIYLGQRLTEFGLLQAIGYTRSFLARRASAEAALLVGMGWVLGVALSVGVLWAAKVTLMDPRAYYLEPLDGTALGYTLPLPLSVLAASLLTIQLRFRRFDPVVVIERRVA
ncbi:MAG: hypothetical protein C4341_01550 [Armatimonadota bacterium]